MASSASQLKGLLKNAWAPWATARWRVASEPKAVMMMTFAWGSMVARICEDIHAIAGRQHEIGHHPC